MTPEELDHLIKTDLAEALEKHASELNEKQLNRCFRKNPLLTLQHAADRFNDSRADRFDKEITENATWILFYAAEKLSPRQIGLAATHCEREYLLKCLEQAPEQKLTRTLFRAIDSLDPEMAQAVTTAIAKNM